MTTSSFKQERHCTGYFGNVTNVTNGSIGCSAKDTTRDGIQLIVHDGRAADEAHKVLSRRTFIKGIIAAGAADYMRR